MSNRKATVIYTFLFVVPYLLALLMVGTAYNALVLHSASMWRTIVGALAGAIILFFAKIPMERPLKIIGKYTTFQFIHLTVRFFMLQGSRKKKLLNFLMDFVLSGMATWLVRNVFPQPLIMGSLTGWLMGLMFISVCLGAYLDFDLMTIAPDIKSIEND